MRSLVLFLATGVACHGGRTPAPYGAPGLAATHTISVSCRGQPFTAEVADDEPARQRGLMFRKSLDRDTGMLFVFASDSEVSFWMKDTYVPLSIAFITAEGRIVNVEDMEPFDEQTMHHSSAPVRYALEMNRGWFSERNIGPGDDCDLGTLRSGR